MSKKHLMKGELDYSGESIVVSGELHEDIMDTWIGVEKMILEKDPYTVLRLTEIFSLASSHPRNMLMRYFDVKGKRASVVRSLKDHRIVCGSTGVVLPHTNRRSFAFNANVLHTVLQDTAKFQFEIEYPLPPNMLNVMLKGFQHYLQLWDRIGNDRPNWIKGVSIYD